MLLLPCLLLALTHICVLQAKIIDGLDDQTVRLVKSYDAIKMEKAQRVPANKLVEDIFNKVAEKTATEKIVPSSARFMDQDYSG